MVNAGGGVVEVDAAEGIRLPDATTSRATGRSATFFTDIEDNVRNTK
jgi:hypothetical protein